MGFLLNAVNRQAAEDHPQIDLTYCVNRNQRRVRCDACMTICPKEVYDIRQAVPPQWDACQNCGLCVSACTARCIAPSPTNAKRHLLLAGQSGETVLTCTASEAKTGHREACLALLPWEYMAYLALGGRLILDCTACGRCPHEECKALLKTQIDRLRAFLGEAGYEERIRVCTQTPPEGQEEGVSRREFFRTLARGGRQTTALMLDDAAGGRVDAMVYRRMLAQRVQQIGSGDAAFTCTMNLPAFTETCYGCGLCAMLCPNKAIEIGEEQDGRRAVYVTAYRCTGCGVCTEICRDGCIEAIRPVRLSGLGRVTMAENETRSCSACGRAIDPKGEQTRCTACRLKKRR